MLGDVKFEEIGREDYRSLREMFQDIQDESSDIWRIVFETVGRLSELDAAAPAAEVDLRTTLRQDEKEQE